MAKRRNGAVEVWRAIRELVANQNRTDAQLNRTDAQLKQTEAQLKRTDEQWNRMTKKTDEQIRHVSGDVGRLTDGWGMFVEALVSPAIPKIFGDLGYAIDWHGVRQKGRLNGRSMEVDVLASGRRGRRRVAIAVSVKSRLQIATVRAHLDDLGGFFEFYPDFRRSDLIGGVAGIRLDEGVVAFAHRHGLYVIGSSGEAVESLTPRTFAPRVWRLGRKQK